MSALAVAQSGLELQALRLSVSASNVANSSTEGFEPSHVRAVETPQGGVRGEVLTGSRGAPAAEAAMLFSGTNIASESITQISALAAYRANIAVLRVANQTTRSIVDLLA